MHFLTIKKDEEIIEKIKEFCVKNKIKAGFLTGVGAVKSISLGFFNPIEKKYYEKAFDEFMELSSLIGNISTLNDEIYLHIHATASNKNYEVVGGHLARAIVSATCEIAISKADFDVVRKFSDEIGLNLIQNF